MKVYNQEKTKELKEYDLSKGYLETDFIEKRIPAVEGTPEESHVELYAEYSNGGKDYIKVIDKEAVPYQPERIESEEIMVYIPFTKQEIIENEIKSLKQKLIETDYLAIKYAEGILNADDYAEIKAQRQQWRDRINELETNGGK